MSRVVSRQTGFRAVLFQVKLQVRASIIASVAMLQVAPHVRS